MRSGIVAYQDCRRRPRALSRVAFRFPKVLDCEARARSVRPPWSSTFCASLTVYGERQQHIARHSSPNHVPRVYEQHPAADRWPPSVQ